MNNVNSGRLRFQPLCEVDHGDPGELYAVPEPAQTGLWDACVDKYVNMFHPGARWNSQKLTKIDLLLCQVSAQ